MFPQPDGPKRWHRWPKQPAHYCLGSYSSEKFLHQCISQRLSWWGSPFSSLFATLFAWRFITFRIAAWNLRFLEGIINPIYLRYLEACPLCLICKVSFGCFCKESGRKIVWWVLCCPQRKAFWGVVNREWRNTSEKQLFSFRDIHQVLFWPVQ